MDRSSLSTHTQSNPGLLLFPFLLNSSGIDLTPIPLISHFYHFFLLSSVWSRAMHPQRPLPQAMPSSLRQNLRDMAMGLGRGKNFLGGNMAYGFIQSLKECLYFVLCCWCIKEILD